MTVRVVALDDYQGLVEQYSLAGRPDGAQWLAVREHLTGEALVARWTARLSSWPCASGPASTGNFSPGCPT